MRQINPNVKEEGAYLIVSDVHLGLGSEEPDNNEKCNHDEFCHFLEWICSLENQPHSIKQNDREFTIKSPYKIVLLGDILELWDPKEGDRDYVIKDCIKPFSLLSDINCDKIYVVGNHDDSLGELEKSGTPRGLKIGNKSYFFLHGHQYDKGQAILKDVSRVIGEDWNPLDWFQVFYNVPFTKNHWKLNFVIFSGLLLGGGYLLLNLFRQSSFWNTLEWAMTTGFLASMIWAAVTGFFTLSSIHEK